MVVHVGRQEPQKDHLTLLEATDALLAQHGDLHIVSAGRTGTATPAIERCLRTSTHVDRVHLLGHRQDVPAVLGAGDVFAFPSRYEGLPGAVIEAMAMGLPVVASDIAPNREALGDGLFFRTGDAEQLRRQLAALLAEPARRRSLGRQNRDRFESHFTIERATSGMLSLYRRLTE